MGTLNTADGLINTDTTKKMMSIIEFSVLCRNDLFSVLIHFMSQVQLSKTMYYDKILSFLQFLQVISVAIDADRSKPPKPTPLAFPSKIQQRFTEV